MAAELTNCASASAISTSSFNTHVSLILKKIKLIPAIILFIVNYLK